MRVTAEPRGATPRQVLDELLKPHHLKAEQGPGGVLQIVRAKTAKPAEAPASPAARAGHAGDRPSPNRAAYVERVTVTASSTARLDLTGPTTATLGREDIMERGGGLGDDPIHAVQSLPYVAAGDDFRSDLSVRGSPYRQAGVVIDGVATKWLQHTVYGAGDSGSLGMLNMLVVERATLSTGVYARRSGDWLGPELELTLRQGSRRATAFGGAASATSATLLGEGPLDASGRGSWLVAVRQSYQEWPTQPRGEISGKPFGFSDAQAKLVYDIRPGQQITLTFLGGRARVDERGAGGPDDLALASNRTSVLSLGWRSTINSSLVGRQHVSLVTHRFVDLTQAGRDAGRGGDRALTYDGSLTRGLAGGLIEAGVQAQRLQASRWLAPLDAFDGSASTRAGYVRGAWLLHRAVSVAPGIRISDSTLTRTRATSRWVVTAWSPVPRWTLNASAGVFEALPQIEQARAGAAAPDLRPERAALVDLGVETRLGAGLRWRTTIFRRAEHDVFREPGTAPRFENALSGTSRGVELLLDRRTAGPFSGWIAYSFGKTRQTDIATGRSFWAALDQRHGVSASGVLRLSPAARLAATFRGGSNFPVPGDDEQMQTRLPAYARLDVRASRAFEPGGRHLTLFAEVLNLLNRRNVGLANGSVRTLFRCVPSAGLLIEF